MIRYTGRFAAGLALALLATTANAAVSLTSTSYTENFDTLAASGTTVATTGGVLPNGWQFFEDGGDASYRVGTGSATNGDTYSFGNSADRALGSIASNAINPFYYGAIFTNDLGSAITEVAISYRGEQWRNGGNTAQQTLSFQYSLNATSLTSGTWTSLTDLDFLAPIRTATAGQLDGNLDANNTDLSGTISFANAIAAGSTFAIRWTDVNDANSDHGLAIDDVSLTATLAQTAAVPEPATWAMLLAGFGLTGAAMRRRRGVRVVAA